ncbi:hypothetical protein BI362_08680 [Streptococcus parauberis]|uniref:Uncharacterized protein n=1 Tax=Streptococcus parauberis KRS-02083 TaxID=1207545 RepID=A0ABP2SYG4_9STRE|nr:hypothetical protein [Streptococcus parauberis]AUT06570.1 hypothetical protein SPSF3K_01849 [Streptococcus parauberis]EMG25419.1 hypothetical protein SPJ1_0830 [Streptococcus parauberis KRS-02083]KYP21138.1 hypothetical protein AKL13_00760 [Streptococcus parauberis]KYP21522.1 hypothetical protein TN39_00683 [Streptococcus parauberis]KYP22082.1 hypothetical protein AKL14_00079 [Streptococcus parauberis]
MSVVMDFLLRKEDMKAVKKELDKLLVITVHAPRKKSKRRAIVSTYDVEIEETATTAKAAITAISGQIDTAIKGKFRTKVETVLENNSTKYDDL